MTTSLEVHLPRPHPKQDEFIHSPAKRKVIRAGRRGGKTVGVSILAVKEFLAGHRVLYAAPTQEQIDRFWTEVVRALDRAIDAGVFYKNETKHVIELPGTEQRIRAKTAWNADTLRGDYADLLILDEWQLMDEECLGGCRGTYADGQQRLCGIYLHASEPAQPQCSKARDPQHAAKLFKAAAGGHDRPLGRRFTSRSYDNPHISAEGVDGRSRRT